MPYLGNEVAPLVQALEGKELKLDSDGDSSITADTDDQIDFKTGGSDRVTIDSSGNVGIGTSSPDAQGGNQNIIFNIEGSDNIAYLSGGSGGNAVDDGFAIEGVATGVTSNDKRTGSILMVRENTSTTALSSQMSFYTTNSGTHASRMKIDSDGDLRVQRIYDNTTSGGANVRVQSDGLLQRDTSSQRYKNTINDATHGLTELLNLRSVTFKGNNDGDTIFGGLIAEEVHDAGLTEFVEYDDQNRPDALRYSNMVSLCIKAIQELKTELDNAKARLTALENA